MMNSPFPTFGLNAAVDQVIGHLGILGSPPDADPPLPVLLRSPDRVVEDPDPVRIPQLNAAIGPTSNEVIPNSGVRYVDELLTSNVRRGLAGVAKGYAAVAVD